MLLGRAVLGNERDDLPTGGFQISLVPFFPFFLSLHSQIPQEPGHGLMQARAGSPLELERI